MSFILKDYIILFFIVNIRKKYIFFPIFIHEIRETAALTDMIYLKISIKGLQNAINIIDEDEINY